MKQVLGAYLISGAPSRSQGGPCPRGYGPETIYRYAIESGIPHSLAFDCATEPQTHRHNEYTHSYTDIHSRHLLITFLFHRYRFRFNF